MFYSIGNPHQADCLRAAKALMDGELWGTTLPHPGRPKSDMIQFCIIYLILLSPVLLLALIRLIFSSMTK